MGGEVKNRLTVIAGPKGHHIRLASGVLGRFDLVPASGKVDQKP
jgi:hypothetical protein